MTKKTATDTIRLSTLKPNKGNPRQISKTKLDRLKNSLESFKDMMALRPIIVDENNTILGGNMRFAALKKLGFTNVPNEWVKQADNLSDEQKREFIIKDNAGFGEWDWDTLANEWSDEPLIEWGLDMPEDWIAEEPAQEDDESVAETISKADELQGKWQVKRGQIWKLGEHRLMCGDSTSKEDVDRLMNDEHSELLFTSPPYSDQRDYDGKTELSVDHLIKFIPTFYAHTEYQVINLGLKRHQHEIVEYWQDYINEAKRCGYKFLSWNVWKKNTVQIGQQSAFIPIYHEWLLVFGSRFKHINRTDTKKRKDARKGTAKRRQKDGTLKRSSIGNIGRLKEMESVFISNPELGKVRDFHPALFPVELPSAYIKAMTQEEDIVCDPFLGGGTTLIACEQLNRKCYGMEIAPEYVSVTLERWSEYTGETPELIEDAKKESS